MVARKTKTISARMARKTFSPIAIPFWKLETGGLMY